MANNRNGGNGQPVVEQVLVKKKAGAIDRMAGLFMKGPSLFTQKNSDENGGKSEDGIQKNSNGEEVCIICYDPEQKPNTFYAPCSHAGVCRTCALSIAKTNETCPICR
jgi:hypothetical protein